MARTVHVGLENSIRSCELPKPTFGIAANSKRTVFDEFDEFAGQVIL